MTWHIKSRALPLIPRSSLLVKGNTDAEQDRVFPRQGCTLLWPFPNREGSEERARGVLFGILIPVMLITLVRHGQSEANAGLTDHLDSFLTPLGQQQAELTAQTLSGEGLTQAYVSPLRRTLQTIAPFCGLTGLRAEVYADICEYFSAHWPGYKNFPGLTPDADHRAVPVCVLRRDVPMQRVLVAADTGRRRQ